MMMIADRSCHREDGPHRRGLERQLREAEAVQQSKSAGLGGLEQPQYWGPAGTDGRPTRLEIAAIVASTR